MSRPRRPRARERIPNDEQLFRAICMEDVDVTEIQPSAIDLQGTSVYRAAFLSSPEETHEYVPSALTGLAVTSPSEFPRPIRNPNVGARVGEADVTWEFFTVDDPFIDDSGRTHLAHAEIRVHRICDRPSQENVRPSSAMKRLLRKKLARAMTLFLDPW